MVRCKVCGYIMKEGKLGDKCPACGAPKTAFEPYKDPMSQSRRRILNLTLHPIAIHFPVTLAVATFVFSVAAPVFSGEARQIIVDTVKLLVLFMPVVVFAAFWLGWWDGSIRFRKISRSQILKTKITYAVILFVVSISQASVVWINSFASAGMILAAILLAGIDVVMVFLLGLLGTSIIGAAFPG